MAGENAQYFQPNLNRPQRWDSGEANQWQLSNVKHSRCSHMSINKFYEHPTTLNDLESEGEILLLLHMSEIYE